MKWKFLADNDAICQAGDVIIPGVFSPFPDNASNKDISYFINGASNHLIINGWVGVELAYVREATKKPGAIICRIISDGPEVSKKIGKRPYIPSGFADPLPLP